MIGFMQCAPNRNLDYAEVKTMMATGDFIMEEKIDGIRAAVKVTETGDVRIVTRNQVDVSYYLPYLGYEIQTHWSGPCLLDGELVAADGKFTTIQGIISGNQTRTALPRFRPFDMLRSPLVHGLWNRSLIDRRNALDDSNQNPTLFETPRLADGAYWLELYNNISVEGGEGVVLKKRGDSYLSNNTQSWYKSKFVNTLSVVPLEINSDNTVTCGLMERAGTFLVVCKLVVPDGDLLILAHMLTGDGDTPIIEIEGQGVGENGMIRHAVFKGLRFDLSLPDCNIEQANYLRKF